MAFSCMLCRDSGTPKSVSTTLRDDPSNRFAIVQCTKCSHIQMSPLPTPAEDKAFYDEDKQLTNLMSNTEYGQLVERDREDTERRVAWLKTAAPASARVLDVGCGYGFFVDAAVKAGYKAEGIDVSKASIKIAKEHGKNNYMEGIVDEAYAKAHPQSYDVIVCFHVLEHLTDPVTFLRHCSQMVKPGGTLMMEVPNAGDSLLNHNDAYRAFYWQRAHLSYFSPDSLTKAFTEAGMQNSVIHGIQRYGLDNLQHWINQNGPQLSSPRYSTQHPLLLSVEAFYRKEREKAQTSDTIMATVGIH